MAEEVRTIEQGLTMFPFTVWYGNNIAGVFESKHMAYKLALLNANNGVHCEIEDQFGAIVFDTRKPF